MRKIISAALLLIIIASTCLPVKAGELEDAKAKKKAVENNINEIKEQKTRANSELRQAVSVKNDILSDQRQKDKEIATLEAQLNSLDEHIKAIDKSIADAENDIEVRKQLFKTRLKIMYENSDNSFMENLLSSKSMDEFLDRIDLMTRISKNDKRAVEELKIALKDVEYKKKQKQIQKINVTRLNSDAKNDLAVLKTSRANMDDQISRINNRLYLLERQEDEFNRQAEALNNVINDLMSNRGKYTGGIMKWPVPSTTSIVSYYGYRIHPIYKKKKFHAGIDIDARMGASIVAANNGKVILAGWQSGYGNTVIIDHGGGIATLYGHCSRLIVRTGQEVKAGELIAKVGSTGLSTGPHLHFEVRVKGATTDPLKYFSGK